ncbi:MAG: hypothetical protein U0360_06840 [Dehalococcoidia bacterium]
MPSARVIDFVRQVDLERLNSLTGGVRFAAALFSWGDVARAAVFADQDADAGR